MFKFSSHYLLLITFSTLKEFQTNRCLHFGYEGPAHKQLNRMSHECWAVLWLEQKGGVRHQSYTVLWRQAVQHLSFSEQTFSVLRPYAPLWAISCSRKLCPPFVIEAWVSLANHITGGFSGCNHPPCCMRDTVPQCTRKEAGELSSLMSEKLPNCHGSARGRTECSPDRQSLWNPSNSVGRSGTRWPTSCPFFFPWGALRWEGPWYQLRLRALGLTVHTSSASPCRGGVKGPAEVQVDNICRCSST